MGDQTGEFNVLGAIVTGEPNSKLENKAFNRFKYKLMLIKKR